MRKSDKEETSSKGSQNDPASEAVQSKVQKRRLVSDPACKPIGLVFNPVIPQSGDSSPTVVVTGFVAIRGVATADCNVTITSLNTNVFLPQQTAVVRKNKTTIPISAFYTPSSTVGVVYVYASNSFGTTIPVGVVLNSQAVSVDTTVTQYTVTDLTYPPITATGIVQGQVKIDPAAGTDGVDVYVSSNTNFFKPQSPVHVLPGQNTAEVPTTVMLQKLPFTAYVAANCDNTLPFGPIPVIVPTPTE